MTDGANIWEELVGAAVVGSKVGMEVGNEVDAVELLVGLEGGAAFNGMLVGLDEGATEKGF